MAYVAGLDLGKGVARLAVIRSGLRRSELVAFEEIRWSTANHSQSAAKDAPEVATLSADDSAADQNATTPGHSTPSAAPSSPSQAEPSAPRLAQDASAAPAESPPEHAALTALFARVALPITRLAMAVPAGTVSLRQLTLPAAAERRLAEVLPFELESQIPFELEDLVISHQVVDRDNVNVKLMVAATAKHDLREGLGKLRTFGLEPYLLTVEPVVLQGLWEPPAEAAASSSEASDTTALILEVAEDRSNLCFVRNGACVAARSLAYGFSSSHDEEADGLRSELRRTIVSQRAHAHWDGKRAFLTGPVAAAPDAKEWAEELIGCQVEMLPAPALAAAQSARWHAFALALALAQRLSTRGRGLNLLQGEFAPAGGLRSNRKVLRTIAWSAVAVLASVVFAGFTRLQTAGEENERLRDRLAAQSKYLFGKEMRTPRLACRAMFDSEGSGPLSEFDAFDVITALSKQIDVSITHDTRSLKVDLQEGKRSGKLILEGTVKDIGERDRIAEALTEHPCFKNIERGRTRSSSGDGKLQYDIKATVDCDEAVGLDNPSTKRGGTVAKSKAQKAAGNTVKSARQKYGICAQYLEEED